MLVLLETLRRRAPVHFELLAVHLDQGQPGHDPAPLAAWLRTQGFDRALCAKTPIQSWATRSPPAAPTVMCARLRRGILTAWPASSSARRSPSSSRDDAIETLLLTSSLRASWPQFLRACGATMALP